MQTLRFEQGHLIFQEGQEGHTAYRIATGRVEIFISRDGMEITLAELGAGDIFGEMAMIEDKPRSASARAMEETEVEALTEFDFNEMILTRPAMLLPYLSSFFERLRHANEQLRRAAVQQGPEKPAMLHAPPVDRKLAVRIAAAPGGAPAPSMAAQKFPFRIGRASRQGEFDVLFTNDYSVEDSEPFSVSRNQCSIEREGSSFYIRDRGSRHGTIVNGEPIGGSAGRMTAALKVGPNDVVLGPKASRIRLAVNVVPE